MKYKYSRINMQCALLPKTKISDTTINPLIIMSQNGPTHFKNLATNAERFLKCV